MGDHCNNKMDASQHLKAGYFNYRHDKFQEAINHYTLALELDANFFFAFYQRAVARASLDDVTDAIADYTEAIRILPECPDSYFDRANLWLRLGDKAQAELDYHTLYKFSPTRHMHLGNSAVEDGDLETAFLEFNTGILLLEQMKQLDTEWMRLIQSKYRPHKPERDHFGIYLYRAKLRESARDFVNALADYQCFVDAGLQWEPVEFYIGKDLREFLKKQSDGKSK